MDKNRNAVNCLFKKKIILVRYTVKNTKKEICKNYI